MDMKKKKNIYKKENNEVEKIKVEKVHSPEMLVLMRVKKNKLAMVGFGILVIMILFCVIGPIFNTL